MDLRDLVHQACIIELEKRIATTQSVMNDSDDSARNETKSSAGDKFETGRAMMQREKENNKVKLIQLMELKHRFQSIPKEVDSETVGLGNLVKSNKGHFYISIGLGKIKMQAFSFIAVSPEAPLVKSMLGLRRGDELTFNQQQFMILEIE